MKIDNNWFCLIWEKKRRGSTWLALLLCVALLAGSFGGGMWIGRISGTKTSPGTDESMQVAVVGNGPESENDSALDGDAEEEDDFVEGTYVSSSYLAGSVMDKYGETVSPYGYTYGPAITGLKRDENIVLQAGYPIGEADFESWREFFTLFQDPQLQYPINPGSIEYDKEDYSITLTPTNYPVGLLGLYTLSTAQAAMYKHDDLQLFPRDSGTDWGNLNTMYLAVYVDLETGEKLDVPQVQVVTMEGELPDTPRLNYSFTDDGRLHFSWTQVEGAEEYFICEVSTYAKHGLDGFAYMIDSTTETEWTSEASQYGSTTANTKFQHYSVADDDWYDQYSAEDRIKEYGEEPMHFYKWDSGKAYCVIAVSQNGSSMMSNCIDIADIQSNLPVRIATNTWKAIGGYTYSNKYDVTEDIPSYGYITMADGSTTMRLVDYDTENAMVIADHYVYIDDEDNYVGSDNVKELKLPYRIEGTPFEDVVTIPYYDEEKMEEDLRFIEEREDMLRKQAGDVILDNDIDFEDDETAAEEVRQVVDIDITANSALSEYLALNMLAGVNVIDVSEFKEAADTALLVDAFNEAYYQNPLILGVSGYKINRKGTAIKVVYVETAGDQARKQEEIRLKISEIISEIITPGMTELEKELAINRYLCDTCTYDDDALANAEQNNYRHVDEEFNDSFTAYGALINGRCVCAGYAAAFKLLADAAGLDSIVVTGTLEGTLPHAWNKVRIDGDWEIVDVTNNDNEFLANALLNLPDEAGRRTLTEDNDYVMDGYLSKYSSTNGQKEYYRVNEMYYSYDEIAEKLAEQLNENGTALLRTEYALDDETFTRIGQEVYDFLETDDDLYGYYWMGVIYLTY